ncbi:MAG: restriction endonuclease subunit S [Xanthomonadales bacterium]|nr:restriction endonuclease subunit S [Xanthomonadales bacterium]
MTVAELIDADTSGLLAKHATWERVPLEAVAGILNGAPFDSTLFSTAGGMPLVRIRDVTTGQTNTHYTGPYEDLYLVNQGDLLVGMDGDFNTGLWGPEAALLNQRVCKLSPNESYYDKRLLAFALPGYLAAINANTPSVTVKHLSSKTIGEIGLPLPPRAEQTRIVEKLEELLSDLDAGVAELKAAQKKLAQYRQSLLKAAVEGALTAEWRAARAVGTATTTATTTASFPRKRESSTLPGAIASNMDSRLRGNDGNGETGGQLLQRILTERRARWEAKQLAKFKEQGKTPPKDWQKKYPEPVRPDTSGLPELPQGWVWASLDMLGDIASGVAKGTKTDGKTPTREVPYLRVANVQRGYLDLSEVKTIQATKRDIQELALVNGDVLFNEGGDRDKLGRGWVWRSEISECIHQNHVFRMRPFLVDIQPELISHQGNTFGKLWFQNAGKQTTNLASINMGMLRAFPVPVAPADEQVEILEQIRTQLESLAQQERATDLAMKQSIAQRQNILRAAFAGQLVPQDPADEPASVLLERIRAERATQAAGKNHGGARRRNPHNKAFDQAKLEFIPANIGSTS